MYILSIGLIYILSTMLRDTYTVYNRGRGSLTLRIYGYTGLQTYNMPY
jgi:hypothetical protein